MEKGGTRMPFWNSLRRLFVPPLQRRFGPRGRPRTRPCRMLLIAEVLEDRLAPAVITVTTLADTLNAGAGVTLRDAIKASETHTSIDGSTAGTGLGGAIFNQGNLILLSSTLTGNTAIGGTGGTGNFFDSATTGGDGNGPVGTAPNGGFGLGGAGGIGAGPSGVGSNGGNGGFA